LQSYVFRDDDLWTNDRLCTVYDDSIGDLPHDCLLAFYESRRRWIFGGTGLTTRGLSVDGVHNGTNCHRYKVKRTFMDESLLSIAGVGASTVNKMKISKMGDFKERLLFANQPIIGYGSNDSVGKSFVCIVNRVYIPATNHFSCVYYNSSIAHFNWTRWITGLVSI